MDQIHRFANAVRRMQEEINNLGTGPGSADVRINKRCYLCHKTIDMTIGLVSVSDTDDKAITHTWYLHIECERKAQLVVRGFKKSKAN